MFKLHKEAGEVDQHPVEAIFFKVMQRACARTCFHELLS